MVVAKFANTTQYVGNTDKLMLPRVICIICNKLEENNVELSIISLYLCNKNQ